ncbi:MAG: radical SAM protein [Syntrophomonadaceae bacterium]
MNGHIIPGEITCQSILNKTGIPGYDYCLNPYVGCTHACAYCYASFMCRFSGHKEKWGEFLDVKVNAAQVLSKQLSRRSHPTGKVIVGTVTDAYQPVEASYNITRSCLQLLAEYQLLEVDILTKSALVERDVTVLQRLPACKVGFTVTTIDSRIARVMEPRASAPIRRMEAAQKLVQAGIPVWIFIAPLLPGLTDRHEILKDMLLRFRQAGVEEVLVDCLNPYPAVVHRLKAVYRQYFPHALPALEDYMRRPSGYETMVQGLLQQLNTSTGCKAELA